MAARSASVETQVAGVDTLAALLESPRLAMDEIGRHLVAATLRRFESERGPDGKPWLKSLRALAENGQTLVDTGRLRGSITYAVAADGRTVEVGTNVVYAAVHQCGGRSGGGGRAALPARPYLGIDDRDRDSIAHIVRRAIEGAVA